MSDKDSELAKDLQFTEGGPRKTFKGSCACKKVTYNVDLSIDPKSKIGKCNCTFCQKRGWSTLRADQTAFHLQTPCTSEQLFSSDSKKYVGNYVRESWPHMNRYFCDECGSPFAMQGYFMVGEHRIDFFAIDPKTLDQPQDGLDLSTLPVEYLNGLKDDFAVSKTDGPYPFGVV